MRASETGRTITVGITADRRGEEQAVMFRRLGARVVHAPVMVTRPPEDPAVLRLATEQLIAEPPDFLIANTGVGIRSWLGQVREWGLEERFAGALAGCRIAARGPKVAGAVKMAGMRVWWQAPGEQLGEVRDRLLAEGVAGCRVAYQQHGDDSHGLTADLRAAGATVSEITVYRWSLPEDHGTAVDLIRRCCAGEIDALTFTSAPAVRNLFDLAEGAGLTAPLLAACNGELVVGCIGPVCAAAARSEGIEAPLVPDHWRLGSLVRVVGEALGVGSGPPE